MNNTTTIRIEDLGNKNPIALKGVYRITREFKDYEDCDLNQELIINKSELPDLVKLIMDELIKK